KRAAGVYHNTATLFDADGTLRGLYRKMHIPDDPLYYEKYYFTPGDLGFRAFDTEVGRIGTLVCWDQWYPEGARLTALQGANVLFYPTAIGWHPKEKATHGAQQLDAWRTIQRSHAIANGCYVAAVNRVGLERPADAAGDGIEFWGSSFLADPFAPLWPRRPRTVRPSCWVRSTSGASRKSDAAGRFCATAGSTLTRGSAAASSTTTRSASPSRSRRHPGRPWLPHASRVGAASRHVARVAAQRQRLAGQIRSDSVGVWRDRAGAGPGRNRPHSRELRRARAAGAARARARGCGSDSRRVFSFPHQPR